MQALRPLIILGCLVIFFAMRCTTADDSPDTSTTEQNDQEDQRLDSLLTLLNASNSLNRDVWQKPLEVLDYLGDIEGKKIADIGAGSGYFTFLLVPQGAKVIAIDIDPYALQGIDQTMSLPNYPAELRKSIELRLVEEDDPKLEPDEVDGILIINTITYIEDRKAYLNKLMTGLKPGGRLVIVDYKTKRIPLNIAREDRLPLYQVEEELYEAGFATIQSDDCLLSYQYVLIAQKSW